jgi:hypothetical protein
MTVILGVLLQSSLEGVGIRWYVLGLGVAHMPQVHTPTEHHGADRESHMK